MSHDTWTHKGVRRIVRPLVATPVTPNHITGLRLLSGLAAAAAVALGTETGFQVGAVLFVISFLLDRADGEFARLGQKSSPGGHVFDLWSDAISNTAIFIGLGIGLRGSGLGGWEIAMGCAAGLSVAGIFWMVFRIEATDGPRGAELRSYGGFDADDAIIVVPIAVLLGWADGLLWAAALFAPAFAIVFLWIFRRRILDPAD